MTVHAYSTHCALEACLLSDPHHHHHSPVSSSFISSMLIVLIQSYICPLSHPYHHSPASYFVSLHQHHALSAHISIIHRQPISASYIVSLYQHHTSSAYISIMLIVIKMIIKDKQNQDDCHYNLKLLTAHVSHIHLCSAFSNVKF